MPTSCSATACPHRSFAVQLLAWLVAALLLAACNNSVDEQALLASAQTQLDKSEFAPAVAQMKTLLQHNPKSAPGRLLLGRALLGEGEPAAAEAELRRALDHGTTPQEAVLPMVAALAAQQKYAQLIKEFGSVGVSNRNDWVEMKTQLGQAYAHTGEAATAERTVDEVLQRVTAQTPAHAAALVLKARLLAERGDTAAARAMADALLARYPGHAEAWMLHGDLLQADQTKPATPAEAVAAYTKALGLKPRLLAAHVALLGLLIRTPDLEAANKAWVAMKAALPNQEATQFYEALLAHLGGDHQRTRTITQMLLRATPDEPRTLMLAARAELALGAFAQAETMLQKLALALPQAMQPRLLLAQALLRNGRATRALESLAVPLAAAKPHADVLALAGQAHLLLGDLAKADGLFAQALAIKPGDVGNRAAQVPSMFVGRKDGKDDLALAELQAIASTDSAVAAADLAPISGRMRRGEFDSALKAVDQLAGKFPQQALPEHLRARIALLRKDVATARASFEQALAKDAAYAPAVLGLADLDLAQDKPEAAKVRLEALLKQDPNNGQALLGLAEVARRSGATPSAVASALGRAAKASPSDAMVQRALIDDQLRAGDGRAAAATAKAALAAVPDEPELLERLGRAQMMADQPNQAVATFNKLAAQRPNSAPVQLQLADAYLADKNEVASASAVRRALVMAPDDAVALRAVIMLTVRENKLPQALAMARTVQTKQPADALGFLLEGDIHASQKDWAAAATVLRKALTKSKPEEVPARLHLALLNAEQAAEAAQFAQSWLKGHPSDTALRTYLGEAAILRGEGDVAEEHFRKLLELQPDEPSVLNNLAKLLVKFKKPGALPFAERAATLAPQRPDVLDTLAQAYAAENQTAKAIDAQRKALNLAPLNADLRLTLAKL